MIRLLALGNLFLEKKAASIYKRTRSGTDFIIGFEFPGLKKEDKVFQPLSSFLKPHAQEIEIDCMFSGLSPYINVKLIPFSGIAFSGIGSYH